MKKVYDLFNKYNIVLVLVILIFIINLLTKTVVESIKFKNQLNSIKNASSVKFKFNEDEKLDTDKIIEYIQNDRKIVSLEADNIILHIPRDIAKGKAIYSKLENNDIPIMSGRFLNIDDFKFKNNSIVIGKNLEQYVKFKENKKYLTIANEELEVIGIMGKKNKTTAFDNTFYVNLLGLKLPNNNLENLYNYKFIGTCDENELKTVIKNICTISKVDSLEFKSTKEQITFNEIYDNIMEYIYIIAIVFMFIIANVSNIFNLWWENNKLKFTINRMVGATKLDILKFSILIMAKQFIVAMLITYIINFSIYPFIGKIFINYNFENSIIPMVITTMALFILCLTILCLPIYKLINKEINNNIRGN